MENAWNKYTGKKIKVVMDFAEDYKKFLDLSKTEREFTKNSIVEAEKLGFKNLEKVKKVKAGDKLYYNNRNKALVMFVVGKNPLEEGINILGSHIDSPRLDLKQHPLYEQDGLVLLDTHYYGGIKKYQWVTQPLALHGTVCKTNGESFDVVIGEDLSDPVLNCSDLLIHLSHTLMEKPAATVIEGEQLDALFGSIPYSGKTDEKDLVKKNILKILEDKYGIKEEDFVTAEFELVPASPSRDLGLDRSMILGYGQDDRVCSYTSLRALFELDKPERTACLLLTDKEEVGSNGNTGMHSESFQYVLSLLMDKMGCYSEFGLRKMLTNSLALSNDVAAAYDPNFASAFEKKNSAFFGKGITLVKYTGSRGKSGSSDANGEYVAKVAGIFNNNDVAWQTAELGKVDQGGGGTIAYILANLNVDVIDTGVCVQNMHACYEATSKVDVYETYRGYLAFLKDATK